MKISILGSTGSIGMQTLDIVSSDKDISVAALAVKSDIDKLEAQIRQFEPELCCVYDEDKACILRKRVSIPVLSGMEGLKACATLESTDMVMMSVVGMIGIIPLIEAIKAGKDIAQANKEPIVCAGHIIMPLIKEKGVRLIPVDSEHSAIFQCLQGEKNNKINKILLTASGGPFRGMKREGLLNIPPERALKHPSWNMGAKITIDSSTLVNKGLEVIEASYLFDVPVDDIQVVVQPGSYVHSMVQFDDGAVKAQLGTPDMRTAISYAMYYKERHAHSFTDKLDFYKLGSIAFEEPDMVTFKGLRLGFDAGRTGGTMPTVFNAANEECVRLYLEKKIEWLDISDSIEECMNAHISVKTPGIDEIFEAEKWAREYIKKKWKE